MNLVPSVLERLMLVEDLDYDVLDNYDLEELKQDVRRSLETLFNTRRRPGIPDGKLVRLAKSTYYYGIPDFSEASLGGTRSRQELFQEISLAVTRYEPRLVNVRVEPVDTEDDSRVLRFRVLAQLVQQRPNVGRVVYDSNVTSVDESVTVAIDRSMT